MNDTSGRSSPWRSRLIPTRHGNAEAKVANDLDALESVDVAVQVSDFDAGLTQVVSESWAIFLVSVVIGGAGVSRSGVDLRDEIVDLIMRFLHLDGGIDEAGRPDDLLHHLVACDSS